MRGSLLLLSALVAMPTAADVDSAFITRLSMSVVKVRALATNGKTLLGSGVVVGPDEVLTNCHVTRDARSVAIVKSALNFNVYSQKADVEHDLCLLRTDPMPLRPVAVRSLTSVKPGERSFYFGFTGGIESFFAQGNVTALHGLDGSSVIETTSGFSLGASGGGLFDEQGRLLGITTFLAAGHKGAYYAMPADWLERLRTHESHEIGPLSGSPLWDKPESEQPYFLRVGRLLEQKRWDEAASLGASWTRAEVANPGAWLSLGTALSMLSRNHEAQAALERTVELSPDDPRGLYQLGVVLARSGQGGRAESVRTTLAAVDADLAGKLQQTIIECARLC